MLFLFIYIFIYLFIYLFKTQLYLKSVIYDIFYVAVLCSNVPLRSNELYCNNSMSSERKVLTYCTCSHKYRKNRSSDNSASSAEVITRHDFKQEFIWTKQSLNEQNLPKLFFARKVHTFSFLISIVFFKASLLMLTKMIISPLFYD